MNRRTRMREVTWQIATELWLRGWPTDGRRVLVDKRQLRRYVRTHCRMLRLQGVFEPTFLKSAERRAR